MRNLNVDTIDMANTVLLYPWAQVTFIMIAASIFDPVSLAIPIE
jgi:hypothetical protein